MICFTRSSVLTRSSSPPVVETFDQSMLTCTPRAPATPPVAPTDEIRLGPFDLGQTEALVGPERAASLYARSGGHPLFPGVTICADAMEALGGADAVVVVTEWPEFARLDWVAAAKVMERPLLIDGRNFVDPATAAAAGFEYEGIGRGDEVPAPVTP